METWREIPYLRFQVKELCFRDYTPFGWDAETDTCSLLIDTAHDGPGSHWAKSLQNGKTVHYIKSHGASQAPHSTNLVVGVGDTSSLGYLLALRELTLPITRFEGAVILNDCRNEQLFNDYFGNPLSVHSNGYELSAWLIEQEYSTEHTSFYINGNYDMVIGLRRILNKIGHHNILINKFWY